MSEPAQTGAGRDRPLGSDQFWRAHPLDQLLAGAEPLASVDELLIGELTDDEEAAFLAALTR
jgi:hypothetical protein